MEAIRMLDKKENLNQDYDEEADVPYISIGEPQNALGVDIGEGAIVRYIAPTGSNVNAVYSVSKHAGERVATMGHGISFQKTWTGFIPLIGFDGYLFS